MRPFVSRDQPQKGGAREEEQTRLEEALTQGTTIMGVRGPSEVLAAGRCPQSRSGKEDSSSVAEQTHLGVKEQKIRKETSLLSQNQTS